MSNFYAIADEAKLELRTSKDGKDMIIGYCAVFNQVSSGYIGNFQEVMLPGCFRSCLDRKPDIIVHYLDHKGEIIGRTNSESVKLQEDDYGLRYELTPPNTTAGRDIVELVKSGIVKSSSFAFRNETASWDYKSKPLPTKYVSKCDIFEFSPVIKPAYKNAVCEMRNEQIPPELNYDAEIERLFTSNYDLYKKCFGQ